MAPGVTADGLEDVLELLAAHRSVLRNASRSLAVRHVQRYENGTVRLHENRSVVSEPGGAYHRTHSFSGVARTTDTRVEEWSNGSVRLVRIRRRSEVHYRRVTVSNESGGPRPNVVPDGSVAVRAEHQRLVAILLDADRVRVTRLRSGDGRPRHRTRVVTLEDDAFVTRDGLAVRLSDVDAEFLVDDRGLIRHAEIEFDGRTAGSSIHVTERSQYSGVGTANVGLPAWHERAPNQTSSRESRGSRHRGRGDGHPSGVYRPEMASDPP